MYQQALELFMYYKKNDNTKFQVSGVNTLGEERTSTHCTLRKWTSNNAKVLSSLPSNMLAENSIALFASETSVPIFGIAWQPDTDYFNFHNEDAPSNLPNALYFQELLESSIL